MYPCGWWALAYLVWGGVLEFAVPAVASYFDDTEWDGKFELAGPSYCGWIASLDSGSGFGVVDVDKSVGFSGWLRLPATDSRVGDHPLLRSPVFSISPLHVQHFLRIYGQMMISTPFESALDPP